MWNVNREMKTTISVLCETLKELERTKNLNTYDFVLEAAAQDPEACDIDDFEWEEIKQDIEEIKEK